MENVADFVFDESYSSAAVDELLSAIQRDQKLKELVQAIDNSSPERTDEDSTCDEKKQFRCEAEGQVYQGEVFDGYPHGQGVLTTKYGTEYRGQFFAGRCHGRITITFKNGTTVTGTCFKGNYHGEMTFLFPCGVSICANFNAGELNSNLRRFNSHGTPILKPISYPVDIFDHDANCARCTQTRKKKPFFLDFHEIKEIEPRFEARRMSVLAVEKSVGKKPIPETTKVSRTIKLLTGRIK